ncbi:hypothetical protein EVAR_62819_1 [Eumeta japonica]|uniref:Uncharacterized protein n=1 Tax=Eumeta variegata TaxID=151549 RepID=A0A4C2AFA4_EUMVA|nr:hypothetical protein EVAR_62819_1 [Eumeta japonica]
MCTGTTDSNQDEEESAPPPLPAKTMRTDRSSLRLDPNDNEVTGRARTPTPSTDDAVLPPRHNYDLIVSPRGSFLYSSLSTQRGVGRTPTPPGSGLRAPTPPPKARHRRDRNRDHNHNEDQSDA